MNNQEVSMDKHVANFGIRVAGFAGLIVVVLLLTSTRIRLPGTEVSIFTGITPLLNVELAKSKADLEGILGPPGSESRTILANRSMLPGYDFSSTWMLFLFILYRLKETFRTRSTSIFNGTFLLINGTLLVERQVIDQTVVIAKASVLTQQQFAVFSELAFLKWVLLFLTTAVLLPLFLETRWVLQFGGWAMAFAASFGAFGIPGGATYVAPFIAVMFAALLGVSTLFIAKPELLYEVSLSGEKRIAA
jgi:hypothetical protein